MIKDIVCMLFMPSLLYILTILIIFYADYLKKTLGSGFVKAIYLLFSSFLAAFLLSISIMFFDKEILSSQPLLYFSVQIVLLWYCYHAGKTGGEKIFNWSFLSKGKKIFWSLLSFLLSLFMAVLLLSFDIV